MTVESGEPPGPEAALERSLAHFGAGRLEAAAAALRHGMRADAGVAALHARLGYVYRYAGWMESSIRSYRRAQELDSTPEARIDAEAQIAKSLIYLGDPDGALVCHERFYGWLADLGKVPDEKMVFYQGIAELYAGRRQAASRLFRASAATGTATLWARLADAYRLAVHGEVAALGSAARAIERRPDVSDGERHYRLVHLFALGGEAGRAARHLSQSVEAGFFCHPYMSWDPLVDAARPEPAFVDAMERAGRRHSTFPPIDE